MSFGLSEIVLVLQQARPAVVLKPRVPFHGHLEIRTTRHAQQLAAESLEKNIAPAGPILAWPRVGISDLWKKAQMTKNRSSKVEHNERFVSSGSDKLSLALDHRFERAQAMFDMRL